MCRSIIQIKDGVVRMPAWRMAEPVNFTANAGEHIAIVGPNGGGKTMLVNILTGSHPLLMQDPVYDFTPSSKKSVADNIKYITFRDAYGGDNDRAYYLQQRWNQTEIDDQTPTVEDKLDAAYTMTGEDNSSRQALKEKLYDTFQMRTLLDKHIILLSSGELRKLKLTETLLSQPRVLIMDNPFIGLDASTREQLKQLFANIAKENKIQIILVLSKTDDIPQFITHVVEVRDMKVGRKMPRDLYIASQPSIPPFILSEGKAKAIINLPYNNHEYHTCEVAKLHHVCISYGNRTILKDLDWTVLNGERWALSGKNGTGKSTLLSLICADNPQSYACDISLFGIPRGTGESIWDIKKHIGYVSPEMHRAYQKDLSAIRIVVSGLKDSVGLYTKPTKDDVSICQFWMNIFGLEGKEETSFLKLSSGEQRLVLLARAFVKDPELLILDEPLHGLDNSNRVLVKNIIDTFMQRQNKTLIMVTHYEEELPTCIDHRIKLIRH